MQRDQYRARANPVIRANTLLGGARYGLREEMKQIYGFDWRNHVRGIETSFEGTPIIDCNTGYVGRLTPWALGAIPPIF